MSVAKSPPVQPNRVRNSGHLPREDSRRQAFCLPPRGEAAPATVIVQSRRFGYEVKSSILKKAFDSRGELQQLLLRFNQALLLQTEQLVATYRHTIEQQWCRLSADEHGSATKPVSDMTQEFAAQMLNVRRESVTEAARSLRVSGAIGYRGGHIMILNCDGLEDYTSESYRLK